ncbi:alpha/beta fold hydrolase [Nocardia asteroides]|uniref:Hydrolase n=1 Tax=Nocardia asteroides NBRC 15531 TaxID=1110697 RepID=U5E428_NOCAS|nr:alpha/beta hydrolase [Nocardia asteroides]TLF69503.1 alpha/beta hydrolase [Nocardia asteroides NBRC 15531]UGT49006.1 alpha/beta hydrolase [Nocardia asteroides]GAD83557.1 putative hydrolase [Nocardia asteroides NBRC 15531]
MLFLDEGPRNGPVIVFVHGIPGSVDWFAGVAERLTGEYRVIRVDVHEQAGDFTAAARTAPVAALLDELELARVTVVGHSFGAEIALELGAVSPRVARVVVVGQAPDYQPAAIPSAARWVVRPWSVRLVQRVTPGLVIRLANRTTFAPRFRYQSAPGLSDALVRDFRAAIPAGLAYAAGARADDLAARPLDERVAELDLPVLAVHGRHDTLYDSTTTLARFAAAGARTHLVEHAGHAPQVEQPDEFVAVLTEFIGS